MMTTPALLAEVSPPDVRGRLVGTINLATALGLFISTLLTELLSGFGAGWRVSYLCGGCFALAQHLSFLYTLPESPVWLCEHGRRNEARTALVWLRDTDEVQGELAAIPEAKAKACLGSGEWSARAAASSALSDPGFRKALRLGCCLQATQQLTGINSVMYYTGTIAKMAGFASNASALGAALVVQGGNFLFTAWGNYASDAYGRRPLVLSSLSVLTAGLVVMSIAFSIDGNGRAVLCLVGLSVYVGGFAPGMAPLPYIVNAEIYEAGYRNVGVAMATAVNWICNCLVASSFLWLCSTVSDSVVFLIYAVCGWTGLYFLYYNLPETKGKALQEIPKLFVADGYQTLEEGEGGPAVAATPGREEEGSWRGNLGPSSARIEVVNQAADSPCPSPRGSVEERPTLRSLGL